MYCHESFYNDSPLQHIHAFRPNLGSQFQLGKLTGQSQNQADGVPIRL